MIVGIVVNLMPLGYFKYSFFIETNISSALQAIGLAPVEAIQVHLPIGISFFVFQFISYLVDIYRRDAKAEINPVRLATYVMMFPHLLAGPIVRYTEIAQSLRQHNMTEKRIRLGVQYFVVGLAQKVLIANLLSTIANAAFDHPVQNLDFVTAWLGALAYTLQIYFDFYGYSNMAIGLASLFGYRFPQNFNYPYSAQSLTDFWRRWHMTLSRWFRDYLYIPLGGNRCGGFRTAVNLVLVFFFCGLWHGANWTFVCWGMFHGVFLLLERTRFGIVVAAAPQALRHLYTVLIVIVGWVFFRSANIEQALSYLTTMCAVGDGSLFSGHINYYLAKELNPEVYGSFVVGALLSVPVLPWIGTRLVGGSIDRYRFTGSDSSVDTVANAPGLALIALFAICTMYLAGSTLNPFLYYRF